MNRFRIFGFIFIMFNLFILNSCIIVMTPMPPEDKNIYLVFNGTFSDDNVSVEDEIELKSKLLELEEKSENIYYLYISNVDDVTVIDGELLNDYTDSENKLYAIKGVYSLEDKSYNANVKIKFNSAGEKTVSYEWKKNRRESVSYMPAKSKVITVTE